MTKPQSGRAAHKTHLCVQSSARCSYVDVSELSCDDVRLNALTRKMFTLLDCDLLQLNVETRMDRVKKKKTEMP